MVRTSGAVRADSCRPRCCARTEDEPIKMRHVIRLLNEFLGAHPDMPLVADTGDALFASVDIRANDCIAPAYYATMGLRCRPRWGCRSPAGAGRSFWWATAPSR